MIVHGKEFVKGDHCFHAVYNSEWGVFNWPSIFFNTVKNNEWEGVLFYVICLIHSVSNNEQGRVYKRRSNFFVISIKMNWGIFKRQSISFVV